MAKLRNINQTQARPADLSKKKNWRFRIVRKKLKDEKSTEATPIKTEEGENVDTSGKEQNQEAGAKESSAKSQIRSRPYQAIFAQGGRAPKRTIKRGEKVEIK